MSCETWYATLARVADDAVGIDGLEPEMQRALSAHLAKCRGCREALETQRAVRGALAGRVDAPAPIGFAERVVSRLDGELVWWDAIRWRTWTYRLAPVAATLLILAGAAMWVAPPTPSAVAATDGLPDLAESWAFGETEDRPAFTVWARDDVTPGALLDAVLSAEADAPLPQEDVS